MLSQCVFIREIEFGGIEMSIDHPHSGGEEQKVEIGRITNINGHIEVEFKLPYYFSRFAQNNDDDAVDLISEANQQIGADDWVEGEIEIDKSIHEYKNDNWKTVTFLFVNDGLKAPLSKVFGGESSPAKILDKQLETVLRKKTVVRGGPHVN